MVKLPQNVSRYKQIQTSPILNPKEGVFTSVLSGHLLSLYWPTFQLVPVCAARVHIVNASHTCSSSCFISIKQAKAYNFWLECSFAHAGTCAIFYKHASNQLPL